MFRFILTFPALVLALALTFAPPAHAHDPFETTTQGKLYADHMELYVTMNRTTAMVVTTGSPDATAFKPEDFEWTKARLADAAERFYRIDSPGNAIALKSVEVRLTEENDVEFLLIYPRPPTGPVRFYAAHIFKLTEGYGDALTVVDMNPPKVLGIKLLTKDEPLLEIEIPAPPGSQTSTSTSPATAIPSVQPRFLEFLKLGIEHILTGYDHLLFLAGLLVVCRRVRTMVTIITCFTLAHSITLALSALNVITLSSRIVEPLIAASILFVGLENIARREEPKARWLVTLGFGLIHGFGFASVLREIGLGQNGISIITPLFAFNLGVEIGQLSVAAIFLPLLWKLRSWQPFAKHGQAILSIIVATAGGYWLIERLLS